MLKTAYQSLLLEAGCDEAGRGCLSGPVFAACVILPQNYNNPLLNDSKKLTDKVRRKIRPIIERDAICWSIASIDNNVIDEINILNASILAMHKAIESMRVLPEFLLIDGNRFKPFKNINFVTIVQGDALYQSIAAASVLAKTYRDDYMIKIHDEFPIYSWNKNMGYATKDHQLAIHNAGLSKYHRKSFKLKNQLSLFQ